jgi:DNA polymerase-1
VEDHVAVIFDAGRLSFRNEIYDKYKANRDETPAELVPQFALVREATQAMGLPQMELAGFEADDLIASYTRSAAAAGYEVVIVSSDKDLMQLVDDAADITMFDAMKDKPLREAEVLEKFGVLPNKVGEVLALMGDSSDNIPGIPGIGPKTAAELIQAYGDVETLIARAGEIKQNKRRESIIEHAEKARLSRTLVSLKEDVPLPVPLDDCTYHGLTQEPLRDFLKRMEFKKLEERLVSKPSSRSVSEGSPQLDSSVSLLTRNDAVVVLSAESALTALIAAIREQGRVAISLEREGAKLIGIALAVEGATAYVPIGHITQDTGDLFAETSLAPNQLPLAVAEKYLKPLLADASVMKLCWRAKEDLHFGWKIVSFEDVCLISYVLEAGLHGHELSDLADLPDPTSVLGSGRNKNTMAQAEPEKYAVFAGARAAATLHLWHQLKPQLFARHLLTVYERIERPLILVLAAMERVGVNVDLQNLRGLSAEFNAILRGLEQEIYALAGTEFLIGSPKQLGEILFERMGITGGKKSKKSGQYSTGVEVLDELAAQGHLIAEKVLEWRQYDKLRSTYTEALEKQINPQTGRVHTTFEQTVAATGRLSSTNPNLQNIPIRTEAGKRIRHAFIAAEGYELISADYSQIELRLLAEMADMPALKQAFRDGQDIHAATASQMFNVPIAEVSSELRRRAKMINFGIIYGISAHGLAMRLGIDRGVAAEFINAYFEHYPGIKAYMEAKKLEARTYGYITTLYGRHVHIAGINDANFMRRAFGERQAINAPLQGTAADIIKRAMLCLSESGIMNHDSRMLLQVHDELLFEVPAGRGAELAPQIKKIMESAAHLSLPLTVEVSVGKNWGEIH